MLRNVGPPIEILMRYALDPITFFLAYCIMSRALNRLKTVQSILGNCTSFRKAAISSRSWVTRFVLELLRLKPGEPADHQLSSEPGLFWSWSLFEPGSLNLFWSRSGKSPDYVWSAEQNSRAPFVKSKKVRKNRDVASAQQLIVCNGKIAINNSIHFVSFFFHSYLSL